MLRLENIKKSYKVADNDVEALKGIDLAFRKNEFVSILGPSGCGKTTMLNIIGGLDKYTSGNLFINGKSTMQFKDSDWDVYRNHRIGFIFQSYNLIPHQTILGNVELALTIAGIGKEERLERAKKAIDRVGLEGQYYKRPNQLSGGQCQRVAIARALVNEPEILLADEPTGALDTQTSLQIMELIKEISREKLVIMVTHNPDLATQYSTRIVRLLDGMVISDSNPYTLEEEKKETYDTETDTTEVESEVVDKKPKMPKEKAKMSFWTAFKLSLRNLFTKKARTALICIAGSIGIIGVSAVLAVSSGVRGYITSMQDDMLSGNPVRIEENAYDLSAMLSGMSNAQKKEALEIVDGKVNVNSMIEYLINQNNAAANMRIKNDITQDYVDYVSTIDSKYAAAISLNYGIDVTNNIYTGFKSNKDSTPEVISISSIKNIYTSCLKELEDYKDYASYVTSLTSAFQQAPNDEDYIMSQYDLIYGDHIATKENEIMIVVNNKRELTDLLLAHLGYYSQDEFFNIVYRYSGQTDKHNPDLDKNRFDYEELVGLLPEKSFYYYPNDTVYTKNKLDVTGMRPFNYNYKQTDQFKNGVELKVVGILMPKETISYGCLSSGFFYTEAFTKKYINDGLSSEIVKYLNDKGETSFSSTQYQGMPVGVTYKYNYQSPLKAEDGTYPIKEANGYVGTANAMMDLFNSFMGDGASTESAIYTLSLRELGGNNVANSIKIYPVDFELKAGVIEHLDKWNSMDDITYTKLSGETVTITAAERSNITYNDDIALVIDMINSLINIITTALIAFTALSLVVSCFMIAIITYVSVVERIKEIGVIRSLGGRKKDVSHLFNAETFILGLVSGLFGIAVTYLISLILNIIVNAITGVYPIASLPWWQALIMIGVSVLLTVISGLIPARSAAKKDPVVALRTE